jgi:malonyl-CoA/methylmalonyl-CoA synthetase
LKTPTSSNVDSLEDIRNLLRLDEFKQKEGIILYTSGTSGPPKGVVLTRSNLLSIIETLIKSWEITPKDSLLHILPLNHLHGLVFALLTYLYAGAEMQMLAKFNAEHVWSKLLDTNNTINSFMAVPTIYVQLVSYYLKTSHFRKKFTEQDIRYFLDL